MLCLEVAPTTKLSGTTSIVSIYLPFYIVSVIVEFTKLISYPFLSNIKILKLSDVSVEMGESNPLLIVKIKSSPFSRATSNADLTVMVWLP